MAALLVLSGLAVLTPAQAGDLDSPGAPTDEASKMYTLEAIYNRLSAGATGAQSAFSEPAAGPTAGTGRTLNEVMGKAPAVHANASATTEVLSGKTFWGLLAGQWGLQTGAMANIGAQNITPGASTQSISQGYHNGIGVVAGDTNLVTGNIRSGVTIFGVAGDSNVVNTSSGDAAAGELLSGKKAWVAGSEVTGGMANIGAQNITPSTSTQTISQGYHNGIGAVAGDTNLLTGNIRSGVTIFGVAGKTEVVDTTSGDALTSDLLSGKKAWVDGSEVTGTRPMAPVVKTGQTIIYEAGDDGTFQTGLTPPTPRFTDNGNGTVTDNMTGLIWLKDANFWGEVTWPTALSNCNTLANGTGGLTDGSAAGDWRLPNVKELQSLVDYGQYNRALPAGHPFTGVQNFYWSSTSYAGPPGIAWGVDFFNGGVFDHGKTGTTGSTLPVRSAQ